jgi:predicted component of type VI protein secretion system
MADTDLQVAIEIKSGPSTGQSVTVPPGQPFLIGRLTECDMAIQDDAAISRQHCQIDVTPQHTRLRNISSNGTRVNGQETETCDIHDGDELTMGDSTVLLIHIQAGDLPQSDDRTDPVVADATAPPSEDPAPPQQSSAPSITDAPGSLQVIHGPAAGKTLPLATGQPLTIGSQTDCDLVIEGDRSISREHCRIELVPPDCLLHDLSTHGTLINHRRIQDVTGLSDGDEIEIGDNTVIRVALNSAGSTSTATSQGSPVVQSDCQAGLTKMNSGPGNQAGIWTMAQRLSGLSPLHAVVDFRRGEADLPEGIDTPDYLLDWHPPETIAQHSPVLLSPESRDQMQSALDAVTGNDAAMLIFSKLPTNDLHQQLRSLSTLNPSTGKQSRPSSLFAFWWPSLLNQMLQHSPPDMVDQIMAGIDAVLVETADEGEWCLFGTEDFVQQAERLGLVTIQESPTPKDGE